MPSNIVAKDVGAQAFEVFVGGAQGRLRREFHNPDPLVVEKAKGSRIWDVNGKQYIDYHMAFGAIALGHNDDDVTRTIHDQIDKIILHGAGVTEIEVRYAKLLLSLISGAKKVLFTNSGSEAVMMAMRLSRAYTGRDVIVKFDGNYHGWHDYSLYNVKTPAYFGKSRESKGIPLVIDNVVDVLPYNDTYSLEAYMKRHGDNVAAIILEPIAHSMGIIPAEKDFVKAVRSLCDEHGCLVIFDEILTFVRDSLRGMQSYYGVKADITLVGKSIANGMPVAAVLGSDDVMSLLLEDVVSSGTYSGHPLSMAGGYAALSKSIRVGVDRILWEKSRYAARVVENLIEENRIRAVVSQFGGEFSVYFGLDEKPKTLREAIKADQKSYRAFARLLREYGVLVSPNPLKRFHVSYAHTIDDFDQLSSIVPIILKKLKADFPDLARQ